MPTSRKTKTNEVLPVVTSDPVVERLDKIVELLTAMAVNTKNIPFQGINWDRMIK